MLQEICITREIQPEHIRYMSAEQRREQMCQQMALSIVQLAHEEIKPYNGRVYCTLSVFIDPEAAYAKACVGRTSQFMAIHKGMVELDFDRRVQDLARREKEFNDYVDKTSREISEAIGKVREERQELVREVLGDCEFMGRR